MDKVRIMYVTDFIRGTTISIAGFIIMRSDAHVVIMATLYVTTVIVAATGALFGPAYQSIVKYIVPEEQLQQANALLGMKGALQNILGMLVAGIVYSVLGIAWVFIINGVSYILSGISELFITADTKEVKDTPLTFKNVDTRYYRRLEVHLW
jgi:MFS transporter, DHA3 family, macrolide efflux protein